MITIRPVRFGLLPSSAASFLVTLIVVLVAAPFVETLPYGRMADAVLVTIVLGAAVLAVGGGRRTLTIAAALSVLAVAARWASIAWPGIALDEVAITAFAAIVGFMVVMFLRFILGAPQVNVEVLCAAVSTYLLLAVLWSSAYMLVERVAPGSFTGMAPDATIQNFDSMYFSFTTLTTVGYGDITPRSGAARVLAMAEATTGTMYVAVLVARLVSLYTMEMGVRDRRE